MQIFPDCELRKILSMINTSINHIFQENIKYTVGWLESYAFPRVWNVAVCTMQEHTETKKKLKSTRTCSYRHSIDKTIAEVYKIYIFHTMFTGGTSEFANTHYQPCFNTCSHPTKNWITKKKTDDKESKHIIREFVACICWCLQIGIYFNICRCILNKFVKYEMAMT